MYNNPFAQCHILYRLLEMGSLPWGSIQVVNFEQISKGTDKFSFLLAFVGGFTGNSNLFLWVVLVRLWNLHRVP